VSNTFSYNDVVKGVIYIESEHRSKPVLIAENVFEYNFAYYQASGIFIRAFTETGKSTVTGTFSSESELQCGGYTLYKNEFWTNYGCPTYHSPVVQIDCMSLD